MYDFVLYFRIQRAHIQSSSTEFNQGSGTFLYPRSQKQKNFLFFIAPDFPSYIKNTNIPCVLTSGSHNTREHHQHNVKKEFALWWYWCPFMFVCFWPHLVACGILISQPGVEPMPPAVEARSLNCRTTREIPWYPLCESNWDGSFGNDYAQSLTSNHLGSKQEDMPYVHMKQNTLRSK